MQTQMDLYILSLKPIVNKTNERSWSTNFKVLIYLGLLFSNNKI